MPGTNLSLNISLNSNDDPQYFQPPPQQHSNYGQQPRPVSNVPSRMAPPNRNMAPGPLNQQQNLHNFGGMPPETQTLYNSEYPGYSNPMAAWSGIQSRPGAGFSGPRPRPPVAQGKDKTNG